MTTQQVADRLVELCRKGQFVEAVQELYSDDIISIEPDGSGLPTHCEGIPAIMQKGEQWNAMVEQVNSSNISDPIVAENFFSMTMKSNMKMVNAPEAMDMDELCVYNVVDGKVVKEQFFYTPMPVPA